MDSLLNRYRNITVLLMVIFAQLVLLAYQVKGNQDVRLIRVWAVTAVTPLARVIEGVRSGTVRTLEKYVLLHNLMEENQQLKAELGKLKLETINLKNELETADRVKALVSFQEHTPSKTVPARVIGTGTGASARMIFVDKGSGAGVMRGMAVITPDGIVGKVTASYPTASQVLLVTDPGFAAGVISQKHRVHGTLKGLPQGGSCQVEYVQNEEKVDQGEMFFTSGDDRVFPKGFPVGVVTAVRPGASTKQIFIRPSAVTGGLEEVLIVTEGVHQPVPEYQAPAQEMHLTAPPPPDSAEVATDQIQAPAGHGTMQTEADRLRDQYKKIGEAQKHVFGEGLPGSRPPDFNLKPSPTAPVAPPAQPGTGQAPPQTTRPAAGGTGTTAVPAGQATPRIAQPNTVQQRNPQVAQPPRPSLRPTPGAATKPDATQPIGSAGRAIGNRSITQPGSSVPRNQGIAAKPDATQPTGSGGRTKGNRTTTQPGAVPRNQGSAAKPDGTQPTGSGGRTIGNRTTTQPGSAPRNQGTPVKPSAQPTAAASRTGGNPNP